MYIIEVLNSKQKCWIADWEGDPPRTLKIENAQVFSSKKEAYRRIKEVSHTHPLKRIEYKIQFFN